MSTGLLRLDRRPWVPFAALLALCLATLLSGLNRFGIWDPWELQVADYARGLAQGHGVPFSQARRAIVAALGFRLLGVHEWTGRLPGALCGVGAVLAAGAMGLRFVGRHAAFIAGLVTLSSPLFLLNALPMGGQVLGFLLQALTIWAGAAGMLLSNNMRAQALLTITSLAYAWASAMVFGMLMGGLPPIIALGGLACITLGEKGAGSSGTRMIRSLWVLVAVSTSTMVAWEIHADVDRYSLWTGGVPTGVVPAGFDQPLERIFHGLAPWSALLPLAIAYPFAKASVRAENTQKPQSVTALFGILCALWCAAGYAAQTLFVARYSQDAVFLPVVGVGILVAIFMDDLVRREISGRLAAIVVVLLSGLLLRDFAMYPESPLEGLAMHSVSVPKVFNPKLAWGLLLASFALAFAVPFEASEPLGWRATWLAPYRLLRDQYRRGLAFRVWLGVMAAGLTGLVVVGIFAWTTPKTIALTTLGTRVAKGVLIGLVASPVAIACAQATFVACSRMGRFRGAPVLVVGAAAGLYIAQVFLPTLSGHLSPREIFATFSQLAKPGEVLAEFKVGGGAAAYYVDGDVRSFTNIGRLVAYLSEPGRRWAAVPSGEFPLLDARFRRAHGRHLVVPDASNAQVLLVTNRDIPGQRNFNVLTQVVIEKPPAKIQHPVAAKFDGKIELLGYDITSRRPSIVGAGESFTLTWYYRVLKRIGTDYKLFVHIDGAGSRVHGDHDPANGKYPTSLWEVGDTIADRHVVDVPASTRVGNYEIMMGFYRNQRRMTATDGPHDDSNRVRAGVLHIR